MEPAAVSNRRVVILYTTLYRTGGAKFERAAKQLELDKRREFPNMQVVRQAVESKRDFVRELDRVAGDGALIQELHFIGHSGLYGIMFGTTAWPEQFSPFEWANLKVAFAPDGKAYFHACRTGRWFAPFFARTFGVKTYGYFWYTTVSTSGRLFAWEGFRKLVSPKQEATRPVYIVSVAGRKSHGVLGSVKKYFLRPQAYPMLEFEPAREKIDTTYDSVAPLYDQTFEDISVRADELKWLRSHLKEIPNARLLDIGCGTGSFLRGVEDLVQGAVGVDLSPKMIEHAQARSQTKLGRLTFAPITGPQLPFDDNSFDVVTSVLSFRYLDWDPIVAEILRVLKPGGRLMVIDMVAAPVSLKEIPRFTIDKIRQQWTLFKNPRYREALRKMVTNASWRKMLQYNPIRSEHEMKWYLQSRFPGSQLSVINYAWNSRIIAFKSPPIHHKTAERLSFP